MKVATIPPSTARTRTGASVRVGSRSDIQVGYRQQRPFLYALTCHGVSPSLKPGEAIPQTCDARAPARPIQPASHRPCTTKEDHAQAEPEDQPERS